MLARSAGDVTLVCRGRHLAAIRERGLSLATPQESFSIIERMLALAQRYKYDAAVAAPFHDMAYACLKPFKR